MQTTTSTTHIYIQDDSPWNFIGNLCWLLFAGGMNIFVAYALAGTVFCLTIVGIPFGIQLFKLGYLALFPFGQVVRQYRFTNPCESLLLGVFNLLFFPFGLLILLLHLFWALICFVSIIGIPFGFQHIKLASMAICPFAQYSDEASSYYGSHTVTTTTYGTSDLRQPYIPIATAVSDNDVKINV